MIFALAVIELHLPHARSLKQKRKIVKGLMDRIHSRYRVSIAETDFHDLHQRAEIALAAVHRNDREMKKLLDGVREMVDDLPDAELLHWCPELFEATS